MMKRKKWLGISLVISSMLISSNIGALTKTETIYSYMDYSGNPYNTTVSNQLSLKNEKKLEDETELKNILNISGDEKFEQKDSKLVWEADNKDIFYEGDTDKELPIQVKIKYYLNGKEMKPSKMVGKKGKIKVEFSFTNKEQDNIKINGKEEKLYTPFVVTMGTILDSTKNTNIEITNGKVINNGTKSMLVSLASPGLYESIGYEGLESLNEISISYDTTSFSLNTVYIAATPKLIDNSDLEILNKMGNLYGSISALQANMDKIEKGAKELENGTLSLSEGALEISSNLKMVSSSIEQLKSGSVDLDNGLRQLISSLDSTQNLLAQNNIEDSMNKLNMLKKQNQNAIDKIVVSSGKTLEELANYYTIENLKNYTGVEADKLAVKANYELIVLLNYNNQAIDETINSMTSLSSQLNNLLVSLKQALNELENGSNRLTNGLSELQVGVNKLYNGSLSLTNGTTSLSEGVKTLSQGTSAFNKDGINKLSTYASSIKGYSDKTNALIQLSKNYNGFASNNANKTMFVYMIKSAKKK